LCDIFTEIGYVSLELFKKTKVVFSENSIYCILANGDNGMQEECLTPYKKDGKLSSREQFKQLAVYAQGGNVRSKTK